MGQARRWTPQSHRTKRLLTNSAKPSSLVTLLLFLLTSSGKLRQLSDRQQQLSLCRLGVLEVPELHLCIFVLCFAGRSMGRGWGVGVGREGGEKERGKGNNATDVKGTERWNCWRAQPPAIGKAGLLFSRGSSGGETKGH